MSSLSVKWFVIINPTSGNGKSKKKWPKIKELLEYIDDLMKNPDLKIKTNIREKFYFYFDILS